MQSSAIIEVKDFDFSYGKKEVFSSFSMSVAPGSVHGILGANGAGKSTLFNCLFEHHKYPGITVAEGYEKEFCYLQTEPYHYPYMTGMEYLKIVCPPFSRTNIELWNEVFRLPLGEYVHNYSTGMKKKIALLGNILLGKKIMLLDEPTNGLDLETNEFFKLLVLRLKECGTTLIISSHVLDVLFTACDRITHIGGPGIVATYGKNEFGLLTAAMQANYGNKQQAILEKVLPIP